ncbi:FliM/FliN family flagellar motor switch protein [Qipengyuania sp. DGS5-3]|uniref:FliM/FliN family flagellar motor switch protein n=1 Tax=Qipengyuania sp. DGS5-3 TaxID=3349632 RepID=UPI0036D282AB
MTSQNGGLDKLLGNVTVSVSVELGRTEMKLKDALTLRQESVVALERLTDELLDVMVNGRPIAKAEVLAQDGRFALRIVEIINEDGEASSALGDVAGAPASASPAPASPASAPPAEQSSAEASA